MRIFYSDVLAENCSLANSLQNNRLSQLILPNNPFSELLQYAKQRGYSFEFSASAASLSSHDNFLWVDLSRFSATNAVEILESAIVNEVSEDVFFEKSLVVQVKNASGTAVNRRSLDSIVDLNRLSLDLCVQRFHTNCREFNSIEFHKGIVQKKIFWTDKAESEIFFYENLPQNLKDYFPKFIRYSEQNRQYTYEAEFIPRFDLSLYYINNVLSEDKFSRILLGIEIFFSECPRITKPREEVQALLRTLLIEKCRLRLEQLYQLNPKYQNLRIEINSRLISLQDIFQQLSEELEAEISSCYLKELVMTHGDLVFANILPGPGGSDLRFVDPKGAKNIEGLYMPVIYDLAKLSQSTLGNYDLQLHGVPPKNNKLGVVFRDWIKGFPVTEKMIFLAEASLFLSLLPLHHSKEHLFEQFIRSAWDAMRRPVNGN